MATFTTTIHSNGGTTAGIEVPPAVIDELGGGKRPLVTVTLNGVYTYDYTIGVRGGRHLIGVSNDHRKASGLAVGDDVGARGGCRRCIGSNRCWGGVRGSASIASCRISSTPSAPEEC